MHSVMLPCWLQLRQITIKKKRSLFGQEKILFQGWHSNSHVYDRNVKIEKKV